MDEWWNEFSSWFGGDDVKTQEQLGQEIVDATIQEQAGAAIVQGAQQEILGSGIIQQTLGAGIVSASMGTLQEALGRAIVASTPPGVSLSSAGAIRTMAAPAPAGKNMVPLALVAIGGYLLYRHA